MGPYPQGLFWDLVRAQAGLRVTWHPRLVSSSWALPWCSFLPNYVPLRSPTIFAIFRKYRFFDPIKAPPPGAILGPGSGPSPGYAQPGTPGLYPAVGPSHSAPFCQTMSLFEVPPFSRYFENINFWPRWSPTPWGHFGTWFGPQAGLRVTWHPGLVSNSWALPWCSFLPKYVPLRSPTIF